MKTHLMLASLTTVVALAASTHAADPSAMTKRIALSEMPAAVKVVEGAHQVVDAPGGGKALRFDEPFQLSIDLKALGINASDFDLVKIQVKSDRAAVMLASIENYPAPGPFSHWYFLDGSRSPFDWRDIHLDLHVAEELKLNDFRKGKPQAMEGQQHLLIRGQIANYRRTAEAPGKTMWLGDIRFVKKAIHLDWDQRIAPYTWGDGKDLVFSYPLTVSNRLDKPVTAVLRTAPFQVTSAKAELEQDRVELKPGETKTVQARIILPAAVAAKQKPLYCERFEVFAEAEGIADSVVTILRSSDPIHLTVTVPIPEEQLAFPLMGRRKDLPPDVLGFPPRRGGIEGVKQAADAATVDDLELAVRTGGLEMAKHWMPDLNWMRVYNGLPPLERELNEGGKENKAAGRYLYGLMACSYLYDLTGDKQYLEKARPLLLKLAELWPQVQKEYDSRKFKLISEGLFADNTLHVGFRVGGTTRPPYLFERHGPLNDFDLLAADLDPATRQKLIDDWILPMGVHLRNHYFGVGNQQSTVNYVTMYAGLAARNWPLVSFAYSSEHGVLSNIQWVFDDKGIATEAVTRKPGYQEYSITPILLTLELLHHQGINHYDLPAVHAFLENYKYDAFVKFAKEHRFKQQ